MTPKVFAILMVSLVCGSAGQYFFKRGMSGGAISLGPQVIMFLFKPLILTGLVFYGLATLCWLVILSQTPLSLAYPFISLSYILVVLMGKYIFDERVTWLSWVGLGLICIGVFLVGYGFQLGKVAMGGPTAGPPGIEATPPQQT